MARAFLRGKFSTERLCGMALTGAGDIVLAAFDGEQRGLRDRIEIERLIAAVRHFARQVMLDEYAADRFQIIRRRQIFVVELAMRFSTVAVILGDVFIEFIMATNVIVEIQT